MRIRSPSRLFLKLLLALWASMLLSFVTGFVFLMLLDYRPMDTGRGPPPFFPAVPWLSGTLTMIAVGFALAWYLSKPLKDLRWALREVSAGHFDTRVTPRMGTRRDEITDLAVEFDQMAAQLQRLTEAHGVLLHDISHELRSPLTRMQAAIGLLRQEPARTPQMLDRIEVEGTRLDTLIGELLTLHRLEAGAAAVRERVDVLELLHAIAEDAAFEAQATGKSVRIDAPGSFVADVEGELIYRAFENVVRNAVKFSPPNGEVAIDAYASSNGALLTCHVRDRGPGVPLHMLDGIFEPFARAEGNEGTKGSGLGLAIAKRAMIAHGGSISAALREGGGLDIRLELPTLVLEKSGARPR